MEQELLPEIQESLITRFRVLYSIRMTPKRMVAENILGRVEAPELQRSLFEYLEQTP